VTSAPAFDLRPYQRDAAIAVGRCLADDPAGRPIAVMPTGTGKTIAGLYIAAGIGRTLWVAHTQELIDQPERTARALLPGREIGVVKANLDHVGAKDLVIASIQSLYDDRRARLLEHQKYAGAFRLVVVDEGQHAVSGSSYERLLDALPGVPALALTATPERTDKRPIGKVFRDGVVYRYPVAVAIKEGWLVPAVPRQIRLPDFDPSKIPTNGNGDFKDAELEKELLRAHAAKAIGETLADAVREGRKPVAFTISVEQAHESARVAREKGVRVEAVSGDTPRAERARILAEYESGALQALVNCQVLCLDAQTEILTDVGFVGMNEMTPEHLVANWENGRIFFEKPHEVVRRPRAPTERMVILDSRNHSIRVTEGHKMLYRTFNEGIFLKASARDLVGRNLKIPVSGRARPCPVSVEQVLPMTARRERRLVVQGAYNTRLLHPEIGYEESKIIATENVRRKAGLRLKQPSELTSDDCALIGFWLGDGGINKLRKGGIEYTLSQSTAHPNIIAWIDETIQRAGIDCVRREKPAPRGKANSSPYITWSLPRGLFHIEPYLKKDGTNLFWGLDDLQFYNLILGFWYADGDHGDAAIVPSSFRISNTNLALISLLQAVGCARGYRATITKQTAPKKSHHKQLYALFFREEIDHHTSTRLPRSCFRIEESAWVEELVWCVKTSTKNIVTRRRGTVTVMGNTEGWDSPTTDALVIGRPTKSRTLFIQMAGRGLRISPLTGKKDCVIYDLVGAFPAHGLQTSDQVFGDDPDGEPKAEALEKALVCICTHLESEHGSEASDAIGLTACRQCGCAAFTEKPPIDDAETARLRNFLAYLSGARDLEGQTTESSVRWLVAARGQALALTAGSDGIILVEVAGAGPLPLWQAVLEPKDHNAPPTRLCEPTTMELAQTIGENHARSVGSFRLAARDASWRRREPSEKVIAMLDRFHVEYRDDITAGQASDMLTMAIAASRFKSRGRRPPVAQVRRELFWSDF